jgi:hypothetical protein
VAWTPCFRRLSARRVGFVGDVFVCKTYLNQRCSGSVPGYFQVPEYTLGSTWIFSAYLSFCISLTVL